jgi:lipid II:glycine glycyltransferase (peptidoglycan interpeptide bridge formation enzyme)
LDKGSVRWAIKKSQKNGVVVNITSDKNDVKQFYQLNCLTKKDLGVPCHPLVFFNNIFTFLKDYMRLYLVKINNEIIAGGIMEYYNDTVSYRYGAANPKFLRLYPYNAFIWDSIKKANDTGFKYYDFGRVSYDNNGLIDFKKRWGTKEIQLYYSYYKNAPKLFVNHRDNLKYKILTKTIRNLPTCMYKPLSDVSFRHFS